MNDLWSQKACSVLSAFWNNASFFLQSVDTDGDKKRLNFLSKTLYPTNATSILNNLERLKMFEAEAERLRVCKHFGSVTLDSTVMYDFVGQEVREA